MLVTSTNSAALLSVGLYIHSVITTWPGVVAPAGVENAKGTTLIATSVVMAAIARIRCLRMACVSNQLGVRDPARR